MSNVKTTISDLVDVLGYGLPLHLVRMISCVVAAAETTDPVVETQHVADALNNARALSLYGPPSFATPIHVLDRFAMSMIDTTKKPEYAAVLGLIWRPWNPKNIANVLEARFKQMVGK